MLINNQKSIIRKGYRGLEDLFNMIFGHFWASSCTRWRCLCSMGCCLLGCKRFGYFVLNSYDRLYKHSIFYCKLKFQIYFGKIWKILICLVYSYFFKDKGVIYGKGFLASYLQWQVFKVSEDKNFKPILSSLAIILQSCT